MTRRLTGFVVAATVAVMSGCAATPAAPPTPTTPFETVVEPSAWRTVPAGPLTPRHHAAALWTGTEVLVIGGAGDTPCPAGADCVAPRSLLSDGAAYDPSARTWRPIAPAPGPIWATEPVLAGDTVYVHSRGRNVVTTTLLAYDLAADRWTTPPPPPAGQDSLAAAGDHVVAYANSHENGATGTGYVLTDGRWTPLPRDPLGPGFSRRLAWVDGSLVLLDNALVANGPSLVRAAVLTDPFTDRAAWAVVPQGEALYSDAGLVDGARLVLPFPGSADGGAVDAWDRPYPFGAVLDLATRRWASLPPTEPLEGAGAFGPTAARYFGHRGIVLDVERARWLTLPPLPAGAELTDPARTAAGRDLFLFGGATWPAGGEGRLHDTGWLWTPGAG